MTRIERATATSAFSLPRRDEAPVALAEEGVGLRGGSGGLAEDALEVGVALAGLAGAASGAGLDRARRELRPRDEVAGGRELGHVEADLGDDDLGGVGPMPVISSRRATAGAGRRRVRRGACRGRLMRVPARRGSRR